MPSSTLLHVPGQQTLDERSVVKLFRGYHRSKRVGPTYTQKESQGGLTVEDSASSLLWLGFNLWSRNFHVPRPWPKKKQWLTDTHVLVFAAGTWLYPGLPAPPQRTHGLDENDPYAPIPLPLPQGSTEGTETQTRQCMSDIFLATHLRKSSRTLVRW